jgi:hypothetical protein
MGLSIINLALTTKGLINPFGRKSLTSSLQCHLTEKLKMREGNGLAQEMAEMVAMVELAGAVVQPVVHRAQAEME